MRVPGAAEVRSSRLVWLAGVAAITLFAFVVRALRLDFVNFHSDEAFFVQIAYQGTFMRSMSIDEPHPPLFLALLQAWMAPAGVSEYAIRLLPVLYGTLLVPVICQLGVLAGSRRVGLAAAFVAAANPVFIFYAREVRDNGLMAFTGALSFVLLLLAVRRPALLPAYVLAALAALFSHYYDIAVVGLELLLGSWLLWRGRKLRLWPWAGALVVLTAAYAPWLLFARTSLGNYDVGRGTPRIFWEGLVQTFQAFTVGFSVQPEAIFWPCLVTAVLLVAGIVSLLTQRRGLFGFALTYALVPLLFGALTLLRQTNFNPRYLFAGAPGYALILGAALVLLWRWHWAAGVLAGAFLLSLTGLTLRNVDFSSDFQPNGYREMTAYLARHTTLDDAVVLDGVSQWPLYWYYAQLRSGLTQRVEFLPRETLPATEQSVRDLLARGAVWYAETDVDRYDPRHDTERLLTSDGYQTLDNHFAGQRLEYFAGAAPGPLRAMDAVVGPMRLIQQTTPAQPVSAGRPLTVELDWQRGGEAVRPFKLSLRLEEAGGALVAQNDSLPLGGYADFAGWAPGQLLHERAGLMVPVGTLPGSYALRALAYDAVSGQALGPPLELGQVAIDHAAPQSPESADLPQIGAVFGRVRLEAVGIPFDGVTPGDRVPITLLWSGEPTAQPLTVSLAIAGQRQDHVVGGSRYPTTAWLPRDVVREVLDVRVQASRPPGVYPVTVDEVPIGSLRVLRVERSFALPHLTHEVHARFGDVAELLGFDTQPRPDGLRVQLVWHALAETDVSYTVFVHALGRDGGLAGQVDLPAGTDRWVPGQVADTTYDLPLTGLPGEVRLEVGLYDRATGQRLAVCCPEADSVILAAAQLGRSVP